MQAKPHSGLGTARYQEIHRASEQAAKAHLNGFSIEALMLMESILSDRIESRLRYLRDLRGAKRAMPASLKGMLEELQSCETVPGFRDLARRADAWRGARNEAAHGMAKIADLEGARWVDKYSAVAAAVIEGAQILLDFAEFDAADRLANKVRPPATAPNALTPLKALVSASGSGRRR